MKTLSGYATTDSGEPVAFAILSNNFNLPAKRVTDAIDDIVAAIVEDVPAQEEEVGELPGPGRFRDSQTR